MSVNEIVEAMLANETEDGTWVDTTMARQIIAALRAGQELVDYIEQYCPGFTKEGSQLLAKTEAWDAATGEEK
jgi:hypothetical protein